MSDRIFIYKPSPDHKYGILELKPSVEKPEKYDRCPAYGVCEKTITNACVCQKYEADQYLISQSRLEVSEEFIKHLKIEFGSFLFNDVTYVIDKDFVIKSGKAYPVTEYKEILDDDGLFTKDYLKQQISDLKAEIIAYSERLQKAENGLKKISEADGIGGYFYNIATETINKISNKKQIE